MSNTTKVPTARKQRGPAPIPAAVRFAAMAPTVPDPVTGCLIWTRGKSGGGYGVFWRGKRPVSAHRMAYELAHGRITDGMHIRHACDTPLCVNPDHLDEGTRAENMADMVKRGRQAGYTGPKLDDADAVSIMGFLTWGRQSSDSKWTQQAVANLFDITAATVGEIWRGQARVRSIQREYDRWDDEAEAEMRAAAKPA